VLSKIIGQMNMRCLAYFPVVGSLCWRLYCHWTWLFFYYL